jgi:hypothetical protein
MFQLTCALTAIAVVAQDQALESESVFVETVGNTEGWNMKAK